MILRRRGKYSELCEEEEAAPQDRAQPSDGSVPKSVSAHQLVGFISGQAAAMKDITLQVKNSGEQPATEGSKPRWKLWWGKREEEGSTGVSRIGISEPCSLYSPGGIGSTPNKKSSSRKPRSTLRGSVSRASKKRGGRASRRQLLTIDEDAEFNIGRASI